MKDHFLNLGIIAWLCVATALHGIATKIIEDIKLSNSASNY